MEIAMIVLACVSPFIAAIWWINADDKRYHERQMKELEIERLKQEARTATWKTVEELSK